MLENIFSMLRKRRRTDSGSGSGSGVGGFVGRNFGVGVGGNQTSSNNSSPAFWDMLFETNQTEPNASTNSNTNTNAFTTTATNNVSNIFEQQRQRQQEQELRQQTFNTQISRPFDLNERFVTVLDQLDANVEKFRKEAMGLQEKRDYLLMSIDLIKSNDMLHNMSESERDEIFTYIQRVNSRLGTVELNVRTVRDTSQEDSLSQINALIDIMITLGDPVLSRQRCQQYLNTCCSSAEAGAEHFAEVNIFVGCMETDIGPIDKKFESVLLGCTLDDQKNIKKRLQALMDYLNKQTISH